MAHASRPRLARACARCAEKKLKCDKLRPSCGRCARGALHCRYADLDWSSTAGPILIDESQSVRDQVSLPRRLSGLSNMLTEFDQAAGRDVRSASWEAATSSITNDPGHLYLGAQTKSTYVSPTFFATLGREIRDLNHLLRSRGGFTVHWPAGVRDFATADSTAQSVESASSRARNMLQDTSRRLYGDIFQTTPEAISRLDNDCLSPENMTLMDIAYELPVGQPYDALIRAYLQGYHTMKPLFDATTFLDEAHRFLSWRAGARTSHPPGDHFLALYSAVVFAGCVVCPRTTLQAHFGQKSREKLSSRFYDIAICAVRLAHFPKSPSLWTFAAFLILNSTWLREEQPLSCCSFVGLAFRVAQMLGLHREPARFEKLGAADVQVRRHLWWTLVAVDAQIALASGLPPLIESKLYHVEKPDEDIGDDAPSARPTMAKTVFGTFVGGRYSFYHYMSDFLRLLNGYRITEADINDILGITRKVKQDMEMRKRQIARVANLAQEPWAGQSMSSEQLRATESSPVLASFATSVLSMLAARPYAIMYGPLRQHGLLPHLKVKEPSCIENCRVFLHTFLKLAQDQRFQPWHWCWPGQHQPLHSILALINELEDFPNDPSATETRKLVDLGLSMCEASNNGGITSIEDDRIDARPLADNGVEAWRLIRRARDEVWEKSGLDSNLLYCPESAVEIGSEVDSARDSLLHTAAPFDTSNPLDPNMAWSTLPATTEAFWPDYPLGDFTSVIPESF